MECGARPPSEYLYTRASGLSSYNPTDVLGLVYPEFEPRLNSLTEESKKSLEVALFSNAYIQATNPYAPPLALYDVISSCFIQPQAMLSDETLLRNNYPNEKPSCLPPKTPIHCLEYFVENYPVSEWETTPIPAYSSNGAVYPSPMIVDASATSSYPSLSPNSFPELGYSSSEEISVFPTPSQLLGVSAPSNIIENEFPELDLHQIFQPREISVPKFTGTNTIHTPIPISVAQNKSFNIVEQFEYDYEDHHLIQHQPVPPQQRSSYSELTANVDYMRRSIPPSRTRFDPFAKSVDPIAKSSSAQGCTLSPSQDVATIKPFLKKSKLAVRQPSPQKKQQGITCRIPKSPKNPAAVKKGREGKRLNLACLFCRERKIACGRPVAGISDPTCNQCARRGIKCVYPTESRRGQHKRIRKKEKEALALSASTDTAT